MRATDLIARRFIGIYINPDGHKNMTFRYIQALYEETYRDGSVKSVRGTPVYERDAHPVIQPLFGIACEVWRVLRSALEENES